jgi:hypothetical protein
VPVEPRQNQGTLLLADIDTADFNYQWNLMLIEKLEWLGQARFHLQVPLLGRERKHPMQQDNSALFGLDAACVPAFQTVSQGT